MFIYSCIAMTHHYVLVILLRQMVGKDTRSGGRGTWYPKNASNGLVSAQQGEGRVSPNPKQIARKDDQIVMRLVKQLELHDDDSTLYEFLHSRVGECH